LLVTRTRVDLDDDITEQTSNIFHDAQMTSHLAGLALLVELGEANPLTELLALDTLDDVDRVLLSESLDKADVLSRVAVRGKDAQVSLATVQRLDALAEAAGNAVVDEGLLEGTLVVDGSASAYMWQGTFAM
jgi:hypothetical protein